VPAFWRPWLPLIDDLWVPSSFVAQGLSGHLTLPIAVVPHPIAPPKPTLGRKQLGLPEDAFLFLFVFSARSNLARKNPAAAVQAYREAFPHENGATRLVLKTIGLKSNEAEAVRVLAAGRSDILVIDQLMSAVETASLIAACDCYLSLHRAEGFGLTVAEAMFFAKPVICTRYSGVLDFVSEETTYLVSFRTGRFRTHHGVFPAGTIMAEPDVAHAASLMRAVLTDRDEANLRGLRAAAAIKSTLSPELVGQRMKSLIEERRQTSSPA
jgi:glycosyltransferase involved in cell wall biosynthesis